LPIAHFFLPLSYFLSFPFCSIIAVLGVFLPLPLVGGRGFLDYRSGLRIVIIFDSILFRLFFAFACWCFCLLSRVVSVYRQFFPADYQILQEIEAMEGTTAATEQLKDGGESGEPSLLSPIASDYKAPGPSSSAQRDGEKIKEKS